MPAAAPARIPAHWRLPAIVLGVLAVFATVDFTVGRATPGAPVGAYKLERRVHLSCPRPACTRRSSGPHHARDRAALPHPATS